MNESHFQEFHGRFLLPGAGLAPASDWFFRHAEQQVCPERRYGQPALPAQEARQVRVRVRLRVNDKVGIGVQFSDRIRVRGRHRLK